MHFEQRVHCICPDMRDASLQRQERAEGHGDQGDIGPHSMGESLPASERGIKRMYGQKKPKIDPNDQHTPQLAADVLQLIAGDKFLRK